MISSAPAAVLYTAVLVLEFNGGPRIQYQLEHQPDFTLEQCHQAAERLLIDVEHPPAPLIVTSQFAFCYEGPAALFPGNALETIQDEIDKAKE